MNAVCAIKALTVSVFAVTGAHAQTILSETFEDGLLDSRLSVSTVGTFSSAPGIKAFVSIEGSKAFGFGRSTNRFNSFGNYVTNLNVNFATPTHVSTVSFDEMEVFANWGSGGDVYADSVLLAPSTSFGHLPYNAGGADTTYRSHTYTVNASVSQITIRVHDITDLSEIYLDRLTIAAIPEPGTSMLLLAGLGVAAVAGRGRRQKHTSPTHSVA